MTRIDAPARHELLQIARSAIEAEITGCADPRPGKTIANIKHGGIFITLRKDGRLRGCIGTFDARGSLEDTIQRMAVAATHDPRFTGQPLSAADLPDLRIDISLLSPLEPIDDPLKIEIGRHGVYIRRGIHTGCFLPEVASEHGWDAATLLSVCCSEKAGLDPLAWQQPGTEVFVFSAEKCHET